MSDTYSPAGLYAGLVGGVLLLVGVIGFFYSASFGSPGEVDPVFGAFDVNAWHNLVHLGSGAVGLWAFAAGPRASRLYAIAFGAIYLVVAIWGFIIGGGESILGFLPVNTEDNWLHLVLAVVGLGAGFASPEVEPGTRERPRPA